jgi:CheY-like chemotaxis protein
MITSLEDFQKDVIDKTNFEHFKGKEIKYINVDEVFTKGHSIVDIIFYLRVVGEPLGKDSRTPVTKPIICTGFLPLSFLVGKDPQYAILYSPGVSYVQLPCAKPTSDKLPDFDATDHKESLKPFLKLRVDKMLSEFRHSYSNLSGMMLYLMKIINDTDSIKLDYNDTYAFLNSLEYNLLNIYFSLHSVDMEGLTRVTSAISMNKKVMLVDDLSEAGWAAIVCHMVYGSSDVNRTGGFSHVSEPDNDRTWETTIQSKIEKLKPHLLLLDLRLEGETGQKNLEDLQGYKILEYLKKHTDYKGIPVIIFTASTNAENVKKLLEMGAEAVWTKPGLDEKLDTSSIVARYNKLANLVEISLLNYKDLLVNTGGTFEDLRVDFFRKLQFLSYRIKLIKDDLHNHYFNDFTDIFIDTNILMSGNFSNTNDDKRFTRTALNIYALARICKKTNHTFEITKSDEKIELQGNFPKIIVHNAVMNELMNLSKKYDLTKPFIWQRALLGYDMIRSLFKNRYVRTEFNKFVIKECALVQELKELKYAEEADPILIEEMKYIANKKNLRIINHRFKYLTPNRKVLLLTDDKKFRDRAANEINSQVFCSMNIPEFNDKMESILF